MYFLNMRRAAEEKGYQGDYRGRRNGSTPAGYVCGNIPTSGNRRTDVRQLNLDGHGCTLFYRADADLEFR